MHRLARIVALGLASVVLVGAPVSDARAPGEVIATGPGVSTARWRPGAWVDVWSPVLAGGGASLWVGEAHVPGLRWVERERVRFRVPEGLPAGSAELRLVGARGEVPPTTTVEVIGGGPLLARPSR